MFCFNVHDDELGWKENHGICDTDIEDSEGNVVVYKRHVLKI